MREKHEDMWPQWPSQYATNHAISLHWDSSLWRSNARAYHCSWY